MQPGYYAAPVPSPKQVISIHQVVHSRTGRSAIQSTIKFHFMKPVLPTSFFVVLFLALFSVKAQAQCDLTQTDLIGASGSFTIPAGQTLCITADFCLGTSSNFPGACANTGPASLHIEGTLRINDNVTFKYQGSVVGSGKIQILQAAGAGGRVVYRNVIAPGPGLNRCAINTSQWAKGVYIVSLQTPQETIREKILVQ